MDLPHKPFPKVCVYHSYSVTDSFSVVHLQIKSSHLQIWCRQYHKNSGSLSLIIRLEDTCVVSLREPLSVFCMPNGRKKICVTKIEEDYGQTVLLFKIFVVLPCGLIKHLYSIEVSFVVICKQKTHMSLLHRTSENHYIVLPYSLFPMPGPIF